MTKRKKTTKKRITNKYEKLVLRGLFAFVKGVWNDEYVLA